VKRKAALEKDATRKRDHRKAAKLAAHDGSIALLPAQPSGVEKEADQADEGAFCLIFNVGAIQAW